MTQIAVTSTAHTQPGVTLKSRFDALLECRHELEHCIAAAHRSSPCNANGLQVLKREMGRLNGELTRYDGLFRTLSRGRG